MVYQPLKKHLASPLQLWLKQVLARKSVLDEPLPDNLRILAEKLADRYAEIGCATDRVSAKTTE